MLRLIKSLVRRLCCHKRRSSSTSVCSTSSTRLSAGDDSVLDFSYSARRYGFDPKQHDNRLEIPWNETFPDNTITVYTDAAYDKVGRTIGSWAVFFGHQHPLNEIGSLVLDTKLENDLKAMGGDASTYLEIRGVELALNKLVKWKSGGLSLFPVAYKARDLMIRTDSLFLIQGLLGNWEYLKSEGEMRDFIVNRGNKMKEAMQELGVKVSIQHVKGHNGDPGNSWADKYARQALEHRKHFGGTETKVFSACLPIYYKGDKRPVTTSLKKSKTVSKPARRSLPAPKTSGFSATHFDVLVDRDAVKRGSSQPPKNTVKESPSGSKTDTKEQERKKSAEEKAREEKKKEVIEKWKWTEGAQYKAEPGREEPAWSEEKCRKKTVKLSGKLLDRCYDYPPSTKSTNTNTTSTN